jgi:hypothetical protein
LSCTAHFQSAAISLERLSVSSIGSTEYPPFFNRNFVS